MEVTRVCYKCGVEKPLADFTKDKYRNDGFGRRCKKCCSEFAKVKRREHRAVQDRALPETKRCPTCERILPASAYNRDAGSWSGLQGYCKECELKKREALRREVLAHYSTDPPFCACCGERHIEFLSIDHINGGGRRHEQERRKNGEGTALFLWLKKHNFPDGYQILCHNCNQSKGYYGICVHQRERNEARLDKER